MNKIIIVVIVIAVAIGGIFFARKSPKESSTENMEEKTTQEEFSGSIRDLFMSGRDVTCDFKKNDQFGEMTGTVYVQSSSKKFRGDFQIMQPEGVVHKTHIINDGVTGYTWVESPLNADVAAIKFSVKATDTTSGENSEFKIEEKLDYSCSPWEVDESKFTPPSNITFMDSDVTKAGLDEARKSDCSYCDQITDANGKAQCQAMLGC